MMIINYLTLICILLIVLGLLLIDISAFVALSKNIKEDIVNKEYKETGWYGRLVAIIFKIATEMVVLIFGYTLLIMIVRIIIIMMKGGNIVW